MPEDFLEDLTADIAAFEAAIAIQSDDVGGHVAAGEALDDLFDEASEDQKKLDGSCATSRHQRRGPRRMTRASHVERAPRRKKREIDASTLTA